MGEWPCSCKVTVTPGLRPGYDLLVTEKCWNRVNIVERSTLFAEGVGDRQGKIGRSKVVVMFTTPKAPVTPGLRPGYDLLAAETCWNRG